MNRSNTPSMTRPKSLRRSLGRQVRWSAAAALLLALVGALEAAPAELKTQGNKIVTKDGGTPVRLAGMNIVGLEKNNINLNLLNSLEVGVKTWKSNVFRLPVSHTHWSHSTNGASYRAQVDAVIARASELGVYVILDLHGYAYTQWAHETFWLDAANRYKNNPAVLFGLLNEPHGTGWLIWRNGDSRGPGMQGLLNAVRSTGANNIVLAAGGEFGYNLSGVLPGFDGRANGYALDETSTGNGIVYDSHVYPWKSNIQANSGNIALLYPVLLGEFGHPGGTTFEDHAPFEIHTSWMPRMMDWINVHNLHWTGWCFFPGSDPAMLTDWSYKPTSYWGDFAFTHLQSYADPLAKRVVGGDVIGVGDMSNVSQGPVAPFSNSYTHYYNVLNGWSGLDLGTPKRITQIKYMPRKDNGALMVGGVFQGSNSADFSGAVTLHPVTVAPNHTFDGNIGNYTVVPVTNTGTYRYVRYKGPAGGYSNIASMLFYTGDDSGPGVNDDVIIIDNGGTGSEIQGTWGNASGYGFHGTRWITDDNNGHGSKSIRYTPQIMRDGLYEVFAIWSSHPTSREDQVPYVITHAGPASPETVYRNQRENGGSWQSLGVFPFQAGDGGNVYLSNAATDSWIVADAVKFVYQPQVEIIMDKGPTTTSGIETIGSWATSNTTGYYGTTKSYHDGDTAKGDKSVRFTPNITAPGQYKVQVWWTSHSNRATNTPITVFHAGGSITHRVNQEANGGQWNDLPDTYTFAAGSNTATGSVRISNDANEHVVVDAVRFLRVGN